MTPPSAPQNAPGQQPLNRTRRRLLLGAAGAGAAVTALALTAPVRSLAQQVQEFIAGPPVPDVAPLQLSPHVWTIQARDGFPTPENLGLFANVLFVVTSAGVVVLDSGSSLQIGEMAIRMIRRVTPQPVVAVFNSHYHGDHWLGNHAFVNAFGRELPIYALQGSKDRIVGVEGNLWRNLMERWTNQATAGTQVVPPNRVVQHGQRLRFGQVELVMHHYGVAHTPYDLSIEVRPDRLTYLGDVAMENRIANMDDGSFAGTLEYFEKISLAAGEQLWVPGHGRASRTLLRDYGEFFRGIWEPSLQAVKDGHGVEVARANVLKDPRVARHASTMLGFESNIGRYISLAFLEAEQLAF